MTETPKNYQNPDERYAAASTNEVSPEQALEDAIAMSRPAQVEREEFDHSVVEASRNVVEPVAEPVVTSEEKDESKSNPIKTAGVIVAGFALAAGGTAALGNAMDSHLDEQEEKNQQWQQEAEQNQLQLDFEEGLDAGKVTIEVPASEETTIPSPEQQGETDTQLPTLPSPEQK